MYVICFFGTQISFSLFKFCHPRIANTQLLLSFSIIQHSNNLHLLWLQNAFPLPESLRQHWIHNIRSSKISHAPLLTKGETRNSNPGVISKASISLHYCFGWEISIGSHFPLFSVAPFPSFIILNLKKKKKTLISSTHFAQEKWSKTWRKRRRDPLSAHFSHERLTKDNEPT